MGSPNFRGRGSSEQSKALTLQNPAPSFSRPEVIKDDQTSQFCELLLFTEFLVDIGKNHLMFLSIFKVLNIIKWEIDKLVLKSDVQWTNMSKRRRVNSGRDRVSPFVKF